jgi:hypothetical protein
MDKCGSFMVGQPSGGIGGIGAVGAVTEAHDSVWPRPATVLALAWAAPASAIGLVAVLLALPRLASGTGSLRRVDRHLELAWHHGALPEGSRMARWPYSAITLGHVVLGCSGCELERLRAHEAEHVRQFERWGAVLLLAYPLAGLRAWWRGGCPWRDNPFEQAAIAAERRVEQAAHMVDQSGLG